MVLAIYDHTTTGITWMQEAERNKDSRPHRADKETARDLMRLGRIVTGALGQKAWIAAFSWVLWPVALLSFTPLASGRHFRG